MKVKKEISKNKFKLKGEKGSLLERLKTKKRTIVKLSKKEEKVDNKLLKNVIETEKVEQHHPTIKLKKKLTLTKKIIKKYDLIISISYKRNDNLDAEKILELIKEAIKDRVNLIDYLEDNNQTQQLRYGLVFNVSQLNNCLIKGPDGDSEEAIEFRRFWGEKSSLRRFEDGSIKEAIYWPSKTPKQRRRTVFKIINYILHYHLGLEKNEINYEALQLEDFISTNLSVFNIGTGEQFYSHINKAKDDLEKLIKNLDLKLNVIEFKCSSALFR